jgi:long-chain acyl-CoA synthetase
MAIPVTDPGVPTVENLPTMIAEAAVAPGAAMRFRPDGRWQRMSYADVFTRAAKIASGLIALGVRPGERVAILGATTPDWTLCDLGALGAGAVVVPIYHTNSPGECAHVLANSGARAVIVEDAGQLAKISAVRDQCPELEHAILMRSDTPSAVTMTLSDLEALGADVSAARLASATAGVGPGDPATIVYTSGTTGPAKGCVLTHANILSTAAMYEDQLRLAGDGSPVVFMFLPLAHVLARVVQFVTFKVGGELAFWGGDASTLLADIKDVRPTHFPTVPRVFEKLHTTALARAESSDRLHRALFSWALAVGGRVRAAEREARRPGLRDRAQYALADPLVLRKVRALFGGRLERALTGAAPIGREVLEFFDACGITILEGYGMTETTAAATLNTPAAHRFGSVGRPLAGVEVRIAADGEILMRGPNVSPGYFDNETATAETFDADGWLKSGDLGHVDDHGYLLITGRKKDLIITSSGKNISPANLETLIAETRWISHAVVYGDNKPYLVALVTIDPEERRALAAHAGIPAADVDVLGQDPAVLGLLQEALDAVNAQFATIEQIKRFAVLDHDLTEADDELTPTLKVKRAVVYKRFRDRLETLYAS